MRFNFTKLISVFILCIASFQLFGQEEIKIGETKTPTGGTVTQYKTGDYVYEIVDEPARFPGGIDSLKHFLSTNIKYPDIAVRKKLEGKCYIQFVVSESGAIENVRVKKGVPKCSECDEEAVRVIKAMPNWIPGKVNEIKVNSTFSLPISFRF